MTTGSSKAYVGGECLLRDGHSLKIVEHPHIHCYLTNMNIHMHSLFLNPYVTYSITRFPIRGRSKSWTVSLRILQEASMSGLDKVEAHIALLLHT